MTAATNEDCIGLLLENCYLMGKKGNLTVKNLNLSRGIFLMGEMSKFLAVG